MLIGLYNIRRVIEEKVTGRMVKDPMLPWYRVCAESHMELNARIGVKGVFIMLA